MRRGPPSGGGTGDSEKESRSLSGIKKLANVKKCIICFIEQAAYVRLEGQVQGLCIPPGQ